MRSLRVRWTATSFLTVRDVAERLKVSQRTVRRWIDQGYLQAIKIGRTVRISEEELSSLRFARLKAGQGPSKVREVGPFSALADEAFARTWDNYEDAVYDKWREIYAIRKGRRRAGRLPVSG